MALTANSFLKVIPVVLTSGEVTAGAAERTFIDTRVEDLESVAVYFNGQLIPGGSAPVTPTSRFYYEVTRTLTPPTISLALTSVPTDTSSIVFNVKRNAAFISNGYASGTGITSLNLSDSFVITYYHVVYAVA